MQQRCKCDDYVAQIAFQKTFFVVAPAIIVVLQGISIVIETFRQLVVSVVRYVFFEFSHFIKIIELFAIENLSKSQIYIYLSDIVYR